MKSNHFGLVIIFGLIAIALFGGSKNSQGGFHLFNLNNQNNSVDNQIADIQRQTDDIKKQIQALEDSKTKSPYSKIISLQYVSRSTDPKSEFLTFRMDTFSTSSVNISGWRIASTQSGNSVTIPKGTDLYFSGVKNAEDNINISADNTVYIVTGTSPIGYSFKVNKCSGFLSQFQTFVPYLSTGNCPYPRNEDLSKIPKYVTNDACFDYIDSMPNCRVQVDPLPISWSSECRNFITEKINYLSCINTHKSDKDFYQKEWRIYLNRSTTLWKDRREIIVLYDNNGKIVSTLTY